MTYIDNPRNKKYEPYHPTEILDTLTFQRERNGVKSKHFTIYSNPWSFVSNSAS
jgi:hypothetical protein